jgi:hypothetical protein
VPKNIRGSIPCSTSCSGFSAVEQLTNTVHKRTWFRLAWWLKRGLFDQGLLTEEKLSNLFYMLVVMRLFRPKLLYSTVKMKNESWWRLLLCKTVNLKFKLGERVRLKSRLNYLDQNCRAHLLTSSSWGLDKFLGCSILASVICTVNIVLYF